MYIIEGKTSGFTSIPMGIYWSIVTLTTVGYGDISPQTPLGQFLASMVMILGYGIIAVPTGIVTAEFAKLKSNQEDKLNNNTNICNSCNTESTIKQARYCHHCGTKLNDSIRS